MENEPFKILIPDSLKDKAIAATYGLFNRVKSIPTSNGCIDINILDFDQEKLLTFALKNSNRKEDKEKILEIIKTFKSSGHGENITEEIGDKVVETVFAEHPDAIATVMLEVYVASKVSEAGEDDSLRSFSELFESMRQFDSFIKAVESRKVSLPFPHHDLQAAVEEYGNLRFEELDDVKSSLEELESGEDEDDHSDIQEQTVDYIDNFYEDDEPNGDFYALKVTVIISADLSYRKLETALNRILYAVKDSASKVSIFP